MTRPLSRRVALSLPALLAAPALAVPVPNPDAGLLSLCGRYLSLRRRMDLLQEGMFAAERAGDRTREDALFEAQRRYVPYGHALLAEVMDRPALTTLGLCAKAAVAMTRVQKNSDGTACCDHMPLWSLCRDLLARGVSA